MSNAFCFAESLNHTIIFWPSPQNNIYILKNIKKNSVLGYRYFDLTETESITLELRGKGKGKIQILSAEDGRPAATLKFEGSDGWTTVASKLDTAVMTENKGGHEVLKKMPILIKYLGRGKIDFKSFKLA